MAASPVVVNSNIIVSDIQERLWKHGNLWRPGGSPSGHPPAGSRRRRPDNAAGDALLDYAERRTRAGIRTIPSGVYTFEDYIECDGFTRQLFAMRVTMTKTADKITLDFSIGPNLDGSTGTRSEQIQRLSPHPDSDLFVGRILRHEDPDAGIEPPADRSQRIYFDAVAALPTVAAQRTTFARDLLTSLVAVAATWKVWRHHHPAAALEVR